MPRRSSRSAAPRVMTNMGAAEDRDDADEGASSGPGSQSDRSASPPPVAKRRAPAKKATPAAAVAPRPAATGLNLWSALASGEEALQLHADAFVRKCGSNKGVAAAELTYLLFQASGAGDASLDRTVPSSIDLDEMGSDEWTELSDDLGEQLETETTGKNFAGWPLLAGVPSLKAVGRGKARLVPKARFRAEFSEFWGHVVEACRTGDRYNSSALQICVVVMTSLSVKMVPSLRHTCACAAYDMAVGFAKRAADLQTKAEAARRQLGGAKKEASSSKGALSAKAKSLEARVDALESSLELLDELITQIVHGVFLLRYRDSHPEVRKDSVTFIINMITTYQESMLDHKFLKYVGWLLCDSVADVRSAALRGFRRLVEALPEEAVPKLTAFLTRFHVRLIEITTDVSADVQCDALDLLEALLSRNSLHDLQETLIEADDDKPDLIAQLETVGHLAAAPETKQRVASKALAFALNFERALGDGEGDEDEDDEHDDDAPPTDARLVEDMLNWVERRLADPDSATSSTVIAPGTMERIFAALPAGSPTGKALSNWGAVFGLLLRDDDGDADGDADGDGDAEMGDVLPGAPLSALPKAALIRLLKLSIDRTLAAGDGRASAESRERLTSHLLRHLPGLLAQEKADTETLPSLLALLGHLHPEAISLKANAAAFKTLLKAVADEFSETGSDSVRVAAAHAVAALLETDHARVRDVELVVTDLCEAAVARVEELVGGGRAPGKGKGKSKGKGKAGRKPKKGTSASGRQERSLEVALAQLAVLARELDVAAFVDGDACVEAMCACASAKAAALVAGDDLEAASGGAAVEAALDAAVRVTMWGVQGVFERAPAAADADDADDADDAGGEETDGDTSSSDEDEGGDRGDAEAADAVLGKLAALSGAFTAVLSAHRDGEASLGANGVLALPEALDLSEEQAAAVQSAQRAAFDAVGDLSVLLNPELATASGRGVRGVQWTPPPLLKRLVAHFFATVAEEQVATGPDEVGACRSAKHRAFLVASVGRASVYAKGSGDKLVAGELVKLAAVAGGIDRALVLRTVTSIAGFSAPRALEVAMTAQRICFNESVQAADRFLPDAGRTPEARRAAGVERLRDLAEVLTGALGATPIYTAPGPAATRKALVQFTREFVRYSFDTDAPESRLEFLAAALPYVALLTADERQEVALYVDERTDALDEDARDDYLEHKVAHEGAAVGESGDHVPPAWDALFQFQDELAAAPAVVKKGKGGGRSTTRGTGRKRKGSGRKASTPKKRLEDEDDDEDDDDEPAAVTKRLESQFSYVESDAEEDEAMRGGGGAGGAELSGDEDDSAPASPKKKARKAEKKAKKPAAPKRKAPAADSSSDDDSDDDALLAAHSAGPKKRGRR